MTITKKPLGVTAIAVYHAFCGLVYLPLSLGLLVVGALPNGQSLFAAGGGLLMVLGVFMLASVYGLWSLQEWGRKLTSWLSVVDILLSAIAIFPIMPEQQFTVSNAILQLVGIGIAILIIAYLSENRIKALFDSQELLP